MILAPTVVSTVQIDGHMVSIFARLAGCSFYVGADHVWLMAGEKARAFIFNTEEMEVTVLHLTLGTWVPLVIQPTRRAHRRAWPIAAALERISPDGSVPIVH